MISATLIECTSPADPPATVKSWLARWTSRPFTDAGAGDDAVGRHVLARHAEERGAVLRKQPRLLEAARVHERLDALARGELAGRALLLELLGAAAELHLLAARLQLLDLRLHRFDWHMTSGLSDSLTPAR